MATLTNEHLLLVRPHLDGEQRVYRLAGGYGLSAVNAPMLHSYPFAWEIAVLNGMREDGRFNELDYSTPLTSGVEVFMDDDDANAFIAKAADYFSRKRESV